MGTRTVEVVAHDPAWVQTYARLEKQLRAALSESGVFGDVIGIEHIGSTAVPGLPAKPIVDVLIGLGRWPPSEPFIEGLARAGLRHHGEAGIVGRSFFTDAPQGEPRTVHVHVVEHGSHEWRTHRRFRDHLRGSERDRERYAALKRELAGRHPDDLLAYTLGKHDLIREVLRTSQDATPRVVPVAEAGFAAATDAYERARPSYPEAAVAHVIDRLGLGIGRHLVDLGAGTGKFTRLVAGRGWRITAVEPVAGMRARLEDLGLPGVEVVDGVGEDLPIGRGVADAVVASQSFHWVDPWTGLTECHRVLGDGGRVALLWNVRDESVDWMARLTELLSTISGDTPRERAGEWRRVAEATSMFTDPVTTVFPYQDVVTHEVLIDRVASISFVAALPDPERAAFLDRLRELVDEHPVTAGRAEIAMPYRTEVSILERIA